MLLTRVLLGLLAVALAVPAVLAARGWHSLRGRIDQLEVRVEALSQETDRMREERAQVALAPLAALARIATTAAAVRAGPPEAAACDGHEAQTVPPEPPLPESREQLEDQFAWQPYDRPWAERTEAELSDAFRNLSEFGAELRPPECRSSMCRVGVVVREQKELAAVTTRLMGNAPTREGGSMALVEDRAADGTTTLILFLARKRPS